MAFMMPVVKQDYGIYSSGSNSRRSSVCSTSPGTAASRSNSLSSSPSNAITEGDRLKILRRRRSRGMSECLQDLTKIHEGEHQQQQPHQQRRRSSFGRRLSWAAFHAAVMEKLKPSQSKEEKAESEDAEGDDDR